MSMITVPREVVLQSALNPKVELPFQLRLTDFEAAMRDIYDFFHDVNVMLAGKGLQRMDDMLRPAAMSGMISDMLTSSLAKHSRGLIENGYFNGHPDLLVKGIYPDNKVQSGSQGVEVKSTRKKGGAVDTHGARDQWMCVFVYEVDNTAEPAIARRPMRFTEVYLAEVNISDFRSNQRGDLGTRTATLDRQGVAKLRMNWIYKV